MCKQTDGNHVDCRGLLERLQDGGTVVIAEGYLWEMERRGFLQFGDYLPEVVINKPSAIRQLHEEFALAGSDVIEAFTYNSHREKLRLAGRLSEHEKLNRCALRIAREVADDYGLLMAGNISNTPLYKPNDPENDKNIMDLFKEQVIWAVEEGADYMIGETYNCYGEAALALKAIQEFGNGLPAVITLTAYFPDHTTDDVPFPVACKRLEDQGAAVVGLNCARGYTEMWPLITEIKKTCTIPIAALPVPYRTSPAEKSFFALTDKETGKYVYPDSLDCARCTRVDVRNFANLAKEAGIQYVGLCCGNYPALIREVAEVFGRNPPASKYRCDRSKIWIFGDQSSNYGEEILKLRRFMLGK